MAPVGVPKPEPRPRKSRDRVTPAERAYVLARDGGCVMAKLVPGHVCRSAFGGTHAPTALGLLSIEHVHDGYGQMGVRAPSDRRHMVALCVASNVGVPSKDQRAMLREYLGEVER